MLQGIFGGMMGLALLFGLCRGRGEQVVAAMLGGAGEAVTAAVELAGAYGFFCGMLEILRQSGAAEKLRGLLLPLMRRLFGPGLPPDAVEPAAMNLTANLLGLGNAATPFGIDAARRMAGGSEAAGNALCLFLVINASSVQLLPTTVIALRAAAGSQQPGSVILPTLIATGVSTAVGIAACKCWERMA